MTKTAIAIIGATGNMGSAIAKSLAKGAYRLLLFAHDKNRLENLKEVIQKETPAADIDCMGCPTDASWEADVITLAIPYAAEKKVAEEIRVVATQKIVVSIAFPPDTTATITTAAEELQTLLPASKVVKIVSAGGIVDFSQGQHSGQPTDILIAGKDKEALELVKAFITSTGLHPLVANDLTATRKPETAKPVFNPS